MIPVNVPLLSPNAKKYVVDCIDSGWISSAGSYISRFEESFASFLNVRYATTTTNGTEISKQGQFHWDDVNDTQ